MYKKFILTGKINKESGESNLRGENRIKKINELLEHCKQEISSKVIITENRDNVIRHLENGNSVYQYTEKGKTNQIIQFTKIKLNGLKEEIIKEENYNIYSIFMDNIFINKIKDKDIAVNQYNILIKKLNSTNFSNTDELNNPIEEINDYNITTVMYGGEKHLFFLFQHTEDNPIFMARLQNIKTEERFLTPDIENIEFLHNFS